MTHNEHAGSVDQAMIAIARQAGAFLTERFKDGAGWRYKGEFDVVSDADLACESFIVDALAARFPRDGVVGEEGTLRESSSGFHWFVDPLDGTKNFIRGNPCFSVTLALERDSEVIAGVVFDPMRDELFSARRGFGAYCNGKPVSVSRTEQLAEALIATGFPSARRHAGIEPAFAHRLSLATQGVRRSGSTALDLAYVAAGRFDAFWEYHASDWDVAAGLLLVREAGGRCSNLTGRPYAGENDSLLADNALLHDQITALFLSF